MVGRLKDVTKIPLPTTQTGRYPRPSWYNFNIGDRSWLETCNEPGFLESYTDAVRTVILDHESAGLDVVSDGCIRYDPPGTSLASWDTNNLAYVGGARKVEGKPRGREEVINAIIGNRLNEAHRRETSIPWDHDSGHSYWWIVEDELSVGNLGIWVETAKLALQSSKKKPLKFSGPSAANAAHHCVNMSGRSDRDVFFQLHKVQNRVLREIADAGCKIIQLDYPFGSIQRVAQFYEVKNEVWKDLVDAFNEEVRGVNAQIWVHFCFAAPIFYGPAAPPMRWHMARVYPHIAECRADCIQSEASNTGGKYLDLELGAWRDHLSDKDYAVGAITPYNSLETADEVRGIVEKALRFVPPEKLALTGDEGIAGNGFMTRNGAKTKLRLLSEVAKKARERLG